MKNQILISFIFLICLSQSKAQFIYPNDEVHISWNANLESDAYLTVTDVTGREIKRNDLSDSATHSLQIETRLLSNGFYHVTISSGHNRATAKFIINR